MITNFKAVVSGATVYMTWDATLDYSYVYEDAKIIARLPLGITSFNSSFIDGAIYQAVDDALPNNDPPPLEPVPPKYITLSWDEVLGAAKYEINIDGKLSFVQAGQQSYVFNTLRLDAGLHNFTISAYDIAGNKSTESTLSYSIDDVPSPVHGLVLSQSGAGNITATIIPPIGF